MCGMKIIYFHQHFSTANGAVGIRSYEMSRRLLARGHQVVVVCGSYHGADTGLSERFEGGRRRGVVDGIEIIEFALDYANTDGLVRRAVTFTRFACLSIGVALTEKYDVLFATSTPLTAGIPGIFARWLLGKRFVFEVRDLWPELPRAMGVIRNPIVLGLMSGLEWITYHSAHQLVALSPGIVEGIARRGVSRKNIALVSNGCDLSIFAAHAKPWRPDQVRSTDLLVVFSGAHGMANGLDAVLDAAEVLKLRGSNGIKLLLIGQGGMKRKLQLRAETDQLDNVLFLDPVNKVRLAGLLAGADLGLQILANVPAFYYGTSPNKFFDYIAAGLPVLNNYPGWLAEIIGEHKCGFAVSPDDPVAFADALEKAADNRELLKCMGSRARKLAESNFNRIELADKWVDWVTGVTD